MKTFKNRIIFFSILIIAAIALLYFSFYSKNIYGYKKYKILEKLNTELSVLPEAEHGITVERQDCIKEDVFEIKFEASKNEIKKWLSRNAKIQLQYAKMPGIEQILFGDERHSPIYFVEISKENTIKIQTMY